MSACSLWVSKQHTINLHLFGGRVGLFFIPFQLFFTKEKHKICTKWYLHVHAVPAWPLWKVSLINTSISFQCETCSPCQSLVILGTSMGSLFFLVIPLWKCSLTKTKVCRYAWFRLPDRIGHGLFPIFRLSLLGSQAAAHVIEPFRLGK